MTSEASNSQMDGGRSSRDVFDLSCIVRLAAEGKLDRRDFQIIDAMARECTAGHKKIARICGTAPSTTRARIAKIRRIVLQ